MPARVSLPKLLLVDDRPANLLALEAVLGETDYTLIKAQSGAEALALLPQHPDIALVLLDVQMPGMDGFEVARHIKETPQFRDVPIIFITAIHTEDPFVRRGYQAGAVDYFSKPFDPEILRLKVGIYAAFRQRAQLLAIKERQLKDSEDLLRAGRKLSGTLESLPVGVIIADHDGRVVQTNDEVLEILKPTEKPEADGYGEFLAWWERDGRQLKVPDGLLARALQGHVSRNQVIEITCLDGSVCRPFVAASPLRGADRRIVGAVIVIQDVTAHREVEADIEQGIIRLVS